MKILSLLFRRRQTMAPAPRIAMSTPIGSVRRKYLLLGEIYSVKIEQGARNSLKIEGSQFNVTLREMSRENFEAFIESWYRRTARKIFLATLDRLLDQKSSKDFARPFISARPQIKIYQMTRAWGRCYYQKGL